MIPTSHVFAAKLFEAGLIPDPNMVHKIVITAEAGRAVSIDVTMWVREKRSLDVITSTLGAMRDDQ